MSEIVQATASPVKVRKSLPAAIFESVWIAVVATAFSMLIPVVFHWADWSAFFGSGSAWIQTLAVFTSFGSTWMCVTQFRFNYIWGVVSVVLLVIVFGQQHLYGSMLQNIYLIPTLVYGWFIWNSDRNTKPVRHTTTKYLLIFLGLTALLYVATIITFSFTNASLALVDSIVFAGSILAQWFLDRKFIENWIVWFVVDVIATIEYINQGLYLVAIQFAMFGVNAIYAWFQWRKTIDPVAIATYEDDLAQRRLDKKVKKADTRRYWRTYDGVAHFNRFHQKEEVLVTHD